MKLAAWTSIQPAPTSASYQITAPIPITWTYAAVVVTDVFGNYYEHQVDGNNHQ